MNLALLYVEEFLYNASELGSAYCSDLDLIEALMSASGLASHFTICSMYDSKLQCVRSQDY